MQSETWLAELNDAQPTSRFHAHSISIKGCCPFHSETTASFYVTPSKGIAKCFGCGRTFLHPVKLVAAVRNISFSDALVHLRKKRGLKAVIPDKLFERAQAWEQHQRLKGELADLFSQTLLAAIKGYPNLGQDLLWAKSAVEMLMARRLGFKAPTEPLAVGEEVPHACDADPPGVWDRICGAQLVGVLPPLMVVQRRCEEMQRPDLYDFFREYFKDWQDQKWVGSIAFMYHDEPGSVCRFKLRAITEDKSQGTIWVSDEYSGDLDGFCGWFGINYYATYIGGKRDDASGTNIYNIVAYVKEGEFDVLSAVARQILASSDDYVAIGASGGAAPSLDRLLRLGIDRVRIVQDNDEGGEKFVLHLLEKTDTERLGVEVFQWPDDYVAYRDKDGKGIKDPDDAIKVLGYPKWSRYVRTDGCYQKIWEWVYDRSAEELDRESPDHARERGSIAQRWGRFLNNSSECMAYCKLVETGYSIDATILHRECRVKDEDEDSYITRLAEILKEHFYFFGVEHGSNSKTVLHVWHKETRTADSFVVNDERQIEARFAHYFGALVSFIDRYVGEPQFLSMGKDKEGEDGEGRMLWRIRTQNHRMYFNWALQQLMMRLPRIENAPHKAQGLHYVGIDKGVMRSYLINGKAVYKILHDDDGMRVETLDGPADDGIIFRNDGAEWCPTLTSAEQMKEDVDLVDMFKTLREMIAEGWAWRHQSVDPTFLAAYSMCLSVMSVFARQTSIMLNAEAQSGKSRFVSGFIGGTSFPRIQLVAAAKAVHVYTAASIRQQWDCCSLTLCAEEFEDDGSNNKKAVAVRNILELFRDIISEQAIDVTIGTSTGQTKKFSLRMAMVGAAIKPLRDAASLSRYIVFELVKDDRRIDPVMVLLDKYGEERIAQMRHQLAVGLLKHIPTLRRIQREVEKEFSTGASLPKHVPARFREAMYPIITLMKFLNGLPGGASLPDAGEFAHAFCDTRRDQMSRLKTTAENEQVFEAVVRSPFAIRDVDNVSYVASIGQMLSDDNMVTKINKTRQGVYFDAKCEWIVVNWIEACQGVLSNSRYKTEAVTFLKQVSERSPFVVKIEDAKNQRVLERLRGVMGPGHSHDFCTVFSVKHLLEEAKQARDEESKSGNGAPPAAPKLQTTDDMPVKLDDDTVA